MPLLYIVGGIVVLVLVLGLIQDLRIKQHTRQLRKQAEQLNLDFLEEGDPRIFSQVDRFLLFAQGRTGEMENLMRGEWKVPGDKDGGDKVDLSLFEYTFITPLGRYLENWKQTTILIRDDALDLPAFSLTPEPVFNAMLEHARDPELRERLVGMADLRFPDHPAFDETMHVHGPDRTAIRALLSDALIDLYTDNGVLCTEGSGPYLLIYRYDHVIAPDEIPEFLDQTMTAVGHFRESETARKQTTE